MNPLRKVVFRHSKISEVISTIECQWREIASYLAMTCFLTFRRGLIYYKQFKKNINICFCTLK